ncbi:response regulator transcription factor [Phenylobacterium sp.]|jgi:CheY-like chemotaxis protein|uniref:response regulator transcription factor n=1 Tax=Phenylobacterium sp. TaxID=1871053 RepID=UPI002F952E09
MAFKILIVDDSKLARMAVAKVLNTLRPEWARVEATDAAEAMALIRQNDIDITLLDFNMPGRDGLELAADLKMIRPEMPVAVISANVQREVVTRAGEAGAAFLPKPLTESALAAFLDEAEQRVGKA